MKIFIFFTILFLLSNYSFCQDSSLNTQYKNEPPSSSVNKFFNLVKKSNLNQNDKESLLSKILKDPDLYNKLWEYLINHYSTKLEFLKDVDVQFKTFQNDDNSVSSLGLSYDASFDFSSSKFFSDSNRRELSFGLNAKGNVALKKATNPNNLLETNINFSYTKFIGGVVRLDRTLLRDTTLFDKLNNLEDSLVKLKDPRSNEALKIWRNFTNGVSFSDEWLYNVSPKIGFETNQDFTKTQFTPSLMFNLGAKAWDDKNILAKLNIPDYPFALLRWLFKTDKRITPYGTTIPLVSLGIGYVVPTDDDTRKQLLNNEKPYPRFNFETGFRTIITRVKKENIFFNANLRIFREIKPPSEIKAANLDKQTYFVMALQSTTGLFVSYSTGKLPLDYKNDQVYSIGFNYKF